MNSQIKIVLRNIAKNKGLFIIKLFSFVLVFVFAVFVYGWIDFEKKYDQWETSGKQDYRLTVSNDKFDGNNEFAFIWKEWLKEFPSFFPAIDEMVRIEQQQGNIAIRCGDNKFNTRRLFGTESNVFDIFNVKLLTGSKKGILDKPRTAVISKSMAEKYFGSTDCMGKAVECAQVWDTTYISYTITGVFEDFPSQSHLHPELFISFDNPETYARRNYIYLKLKPNATPANIINHFGEFKKQYCDLNYENELEIHLQPISDIHLFSHKAREIEDGGNPVVLRIMLITLFILILIVLINHTNLQISQNAKFSRLLFVQETFGCKKTLQAKYLAGHSFIVLTLAFVISAIAFKPLYSLLQYYLNIRFSIAWVTIITSLAVLYSILLIIISLIDFLIVNITLNTRHLVNKTFAGLKQGDPIAKQSKTRVVLTIAQTSITIFLIVASIISARQIDLMLRNRLGQGANNIINLKNLPRKAVDNYELFKERLIKNPAVLDVTSSMEEPSGQTNDRSKFSFDGKEYPDKQIYILPVDYNFNSFYHNELIAGDDLQYEKKREASERYVINETTMHYLGYTKPEDIIGKNFQYLLGTEGFFYPGYISGVVKDFHLSSMEEKEKPMVLYYLTFFNYSFSIKVEPTAMISGIEALNKTWEELFPNYPLEYYFIDQLYDNLYYQYIMQSRFINLLLLIILTISNIGLFAVVYIQLKQRTKEIGIRKINGANVSEVMAMLNKSFVKWVTIAFVAATPVSWYVMQKWLENFAYKTTLNWWIFALAGLLALGIAILTVSWQSWRAATKNPVEALRYE